MTNEELKQQVAKIRFDIYDRNLSRIKELNKKKISLRDWKEQFDELINEIESEIASAISYLYEDVDL